MKNNNAILVFTFFFLAAVGSIGASDSNLFYSTAPLHVGTLGPDGKLVILQSYDRFATLNENYGFIIWGPNFSKENRIKYHFFSQPDLKWIVTWDLQKFLDLVSTVPERESLYFFNQCNAPTWFGIEEKKLNKIISKVEKVANRRNLTIKEYMINTCMQAPIQKKTAQQGGPAEAPRAPR